MLIAWFAFVVVPWVFYRNITLCSFMYNVRICYTHLKLLHKCILFKCDPGWLANSVNNIKTDFILACSLFIYIFERVLLFSFSYNLINELCLQKLDLRSNQIWFNYLFYPNAAHIHSDIYITEAKAALQHPFQCVFKL